jgi:hypothetical protein
LSEPRETVKEMVVHFTDVPIGRHLVGAVCLHVGDKTYDVIRWPESGSVDIRVVRIDVHFVRERPGV